MPQHDLLLNPLSKARMIACQSIPFEHFFAPPLYYFNNGLHQTFDKNVQKNDQILKSKAETNRHFYRALMLCRLERHKKALSKIDNEIVQQKMLLTSAQLNKTIFDYTYLCYFNCLKATCHFILKDYSTAKEIFFTLFNDCAIHNSFEGHLKFSWDISAWALIMRARCTLCLPETNIQEAIFDLQTSVRQLIKFQALHSERQVNACLAYAILGDIKEFRHSYDLARGYSSQHYLLNDLQTLNNLF